MHVLVFIASIIALSQGGTIPQNASIVLRLDGSILPGATSLAFWNDTTSPNRFNATQTSLSSRPAVIPYNRFCSSTVRFQQKFMTIPSNVALNPQTQGFSWAIVSRESSSNEANSIGKTDTFYADWRVGQGGAGGALSTVQTYSGSTGFCAAATYSQSDLQHFQVWVGTLAAGSGSTVRPLTGYIDGSALGWQNRWTGCGSFVQGSVNSANPVTIGSSLYNGDILEIIVWKGVALSQADVNELQTYFEDKYFFYCPAIAPVGATLVGSCSGPKIRDYATCTQSCNPPNIRVSGTAALTCMVGQWSGAPLVCEPPCLTLTLPENADTCSKLLLDEDFTPSGNTLARWNIAPAVPAAVSSSFWTLSNGALSTNAGAQCTYSATSRYSTLTLSQPKWLDTMEPNQFMALTVTVGIQSGLMGVAFRFSDENNHYYFLLDAPNGRFEWGKVAAGTFSAVNTAAWSTPSEFIGVAVNLSVTSVGGVHTVNVTNTGSSFSWSDSTYTKGSFGFVSKGVGYFDDVVASTSCDGAGQVCSDFTSGMTCSFTCAEGYTVLTGDLSRTCTMGAWSGSNVVCAINPPVFGPSSCDISEDAGANGPCGAPLNATHTGVDVSLTYQIVGGTGASVFKVGQCDGQIRLRVSNSLDYNASSSYTLEIQAVPNGFTSSATTATITVNVLYVNKPPVFNDAGVRSVFENQTALAPFGDPVSVSDPQGATITFSVLTTTLGGSMFGIQPFGGRLYPLAANLDYRVSQAYQIQVQATNTYGLSAQQLFTVQILYVNKPPFMSNVSYTVSNASASPGYVFSPPVSAQDPQNSPINYAIIGPETSTFFMDGTSGQLSLITSITSDYTITLQLENELGLVGTGYINVRVTPVGAASLLGIGLPASGFASTVGNDTIVLIGSNFLPSATFTASYSVDGSTVFHSPHCVFNDTTQVFCNTSAGYGTRLAWRLYQNGAEVLRPPGISPLLMSYASPTVSSVSQYVDFPTRPDSPASITITGSNFFNDCSVVTVFAGPWQWTPTQCSFGSLTVTTSGGAGGSLVLNITVGNTWGTASSNVSYVAPVIDSLVAGLLPTYGGGVVMIYGSGFGIAASGLSVTYGGGPDGRTYTATCTRQPFTSPVQESLQCLNAAGVGFGHRWRVCVMNQCTGMSANETSYVGPSISSITGAGALNANTGGGQSVVLTGTGFGPPAATLIISVTYGKTGSAYSAFGCAVTQDGPSLSQMTCLTVPGTGAHLLWTMSIAWQSAPLFNGTSYGPPSIAYFSGPGAVNAATSGFQLLTIVGNNFGASLATLNDIYYVLTVVNPVNASLPVVPISPATNGTVFFRPVSCVFTVPHTQIDCLTSRGGGANLQWTIVVDGQANQVPVTNYAVPVITSVVYPSNGVVPTGTNGVRTDGNLTLRLIGGQFGPSTAPLVQYVRVQSPVSELPVLAFTVQSDTILDVVIAPGVGKNLSFVVRVADQLSSATPAVFDYLSPSILAISPSSGPTFASTGFTVTLTGLNLGQSSGATVVVQVGNAEDSTLSAWIPAQPVFPPGDNGTARLRPNETIQFQLPPGVGLSRAVKLAVYPSIYSEFAVYSNPVTDGTAARFSYTSPTLTAVVSGTVDPSTNDAITARTLFGPGVDLLQVRKIFVNGTNFGALARLQGTGVQLFVDSQPYVSSSPPVDSLWVSNAIRYSAWVDTSIVAFTLQQSSFVRLRLVTRDFSTGFVTNVTSNVLPFQDVSPQITGVLSGSLPPTSGSTNLVFSCSHLETAETISVTVGGSPCPVLNPLTGAVVPANNVPAMLYAVYGANNVEYPVTCVVPPGQGGAVGVILTRDTSPSAPWLIAYAGPTVDTVTATDPNAPTVTTPALGTLHLAPTIGGMFTFTGSNFGLAPVVNVTSGTYSKLIGFVPGFPNYEPGTSRSHTVLTFPVPPGEGKGWLIWVVVGDQQWANPVAFSYKPPVVTSIISGSSTAGDGIATLNGYNFGVSVVLGAPPPTVSLLRGDGKVFACNPLAPVVPACAVPIPSRSHTEIQFVVPPGAGKSLNVLLNVGGQSVTIPGFSYAPPLISAMIAVGIGPGGSNVTVSGVASNPRPIMYVPAAGSFELQLYGANFGPGNDAPFVFTRWQAKADKVPIGDRLETFVGEGEVFTGDLLFVDHTFVRFRVSPGLGTRDVIMQAYDQVPVINGQYQHQAPQLTSMSLNLFPTDSGVAVTVTGSNFGPPTVARSSFVPIPLPLSDFNRPTTGLLVIAFGTKCAVSACSEAQCMPEALKSCDAGAITSHSDSSVVFTSLPGIGVDLNVTMSVLEPVLVPPGTRNLTGTGEATFSYLPPSVDFISPAVLSMDSRTTGYLLEVHGDNVGLLGDLVLPGDSVVQVLVDNATCDNAQRRVVSNPVSGPMTLLACSLNQTTTGFKNMTLFAARQWGPTLNATSFNALHVVCSANYYAMQGEVCLPCPPGASCAGFVNNVLTLPVALSGWYNLNGTVIGPANKTLFDLCPDKRGLSGRLDKTCVVPCQPTEACTGNNLCAVGYKDAGPNYRCSVCADNYYMSAGLCVKCPSAPWVLIVAFIAVSILLAIGGWILSRKNVNIAFMSIGVDYFQVLAMFAQSKVKWPSFIAEAFRIFSAFNFNIDITAPECALKSMSYETKWWISMQLPVGAAVIFLIIFVSNLLYKRVFMCVKTRAKLLSHKNALIGMFFVMFYFLYLYLTRTVFDIFNCSPTIPSDGKEYLQVAFVECGTGFQKRLAPFAVMYLLLYALGYPGFVAVLIFRNRIKIMEDQLLVAKGTGETRLSNPHCYDFRKKYHKLYYQFKPNQYYWILVVISRKFLIAVTALLFRKNTSFQLAVALLVLFIAYALQVRYRPYLSPSEKGDVLRDHVYHSLQGGIHVELARRVKEAEAHGKKAARNTKMSSVVKGPPTVVAFNSVVQYFFNYNTVEMVLLFCCVLISLAGIMFDSDRFQDATFNSQKDVITGIVITVIIGSVLYFVTVVAGEVYVVHKQRKYMKELHGDNDGDEGDRRGSRDVGKDKKKFGVAGSGVSSKKRNSTFGGGGGSGRSVEMSSMALVRDERTMEFVPDIRTLKTEVNPLFNVINLKGEAATKGALQVVADSPLSRHEHRPRQFNREEAQLTQETIASMVEPPPQEAWESIRGVFVDLVQQVDALSKEVLELKRSSELGGLMPTRGSAMSISRSLLGSVRGPKAVRPVVRTKKVFQESGPDSSLTSVIVTNPVASAAESVTASRISSPASSAPPPTNLPSTSDADL